MKTINSALIMKSNHQYFVRDCFSCHLRGVAFKNNLCVRSLRAASLLLHTHMVSVKAYVIRSASAGSMENEKRCSSITARTLASKIACTSEVRGAWVFIWYTDALCLLTPADTDYSCSTLRSPSAGRGRCACRLGTPGNRKRWAPVEVQGWDYSCLADRDGESD